MRVLILSANTGGGHNSTARAVAEQLEKQNAECEIVDALAYISEKFSEFISWGHSYVYRKLPRLFGVGYRFEEKHTPHFIYEQCARGAETLYAKLEEGYDAVICTHVFTGMMMTAVREHYGNTVPSYFIATDYTCSPGVSELKLDGFFIPHRMLLGEFIRAGIPADKLYATGIPISEGFYEKETREEARRALGLPVEKRVVLLSCGSMGCGHLERSALHLFRHMPKDSVLVVLCGNNQKTYEELLPEANERLIVLSYTDQMVRYMSAADLYITKPGGLTTTEAIAMHLPMVFVNAVPGCETRNFDFLIHQGVACGSGSWHQVTYLVQKALRDPKVMASQIEHMQAFQTGQAADLIARYVLGYKQ